MATFAAVDALGLWMSMVPSTLPRLAMVAGRQAHTNGGPLAELPAGPAGPCGPGGPAGPCGPSTFHWMRTSLVRQSVVESTSRRLPLPGLTHASMTDVVASAAVETRSKPSARKTDRVFMRASLVIGWWEL